MTVNVLMCVQCGRNPRHSRGLCGGCYATAFRHNELDEYPTQKYLENPEAYIRWAFRYHPELVAEVAVEYGKRVQDAS